MAGEKLESLAVDDEGTDDEGDPHDEDPAEDDEGEYEIGSDMIQTLNDARRLVYQLFVWQSISWGM